MRHNEGLRVARFLMVLSSLSPLFLLWAVRGSSAIKHSYLVPICLAFTIVPNLALLLRLSVVKKRDDTCTITPAVVHDQKDHIIVYLFAMLIPFFDANIGHARDFLAVCGALAFVVFIFWKLNLHYVNLIFALLGYNVFTVTVNRPSSDGKTVPDTVVVLSKSDVLPPQQAVTAYRLSNSVLFEKGGADNVRV